MSAQKYAMKMKLSTNKQLYCLDDNRTTTTATAKQPTHTSEQTIE